MFHFDIESSEKGICRLEVHLQSYEDCLDEPAIPSDPTRGSAEILEIYASGYYSIASKGDLRGPSTGSVS